MIPSARVVIELLKITGIPAVALPSSWYRYARASIQAGAGPLVYTGRSKPIRAAGGDFDLTQEAVKWEFEVQPNRDTDIDVRVELYQDRGDAEAPLPIVISGSVADPWTNGPRTFGAGPIVEALVTTTPINPTDRALLARAGTPSGVSGTLTLPRGIIVQFVNIAGLYKPDPAARPPAHGSRVVRGYFSEDHQGRIFTNRLPDGTWARDTQYAVY
jgi:hypothetical protein